MPRFLRLANIGMLVLFAAWVGFQYNDPDALLWAAVYGAAAIECVLFILGRFPRALGVAYMILCLLWALVLAVRVVIEGAFIFDETGREMMGLLICAGWTFVLYHYAERGPLGGT